MKINRLLLGLGLALSIAGCGGPKKKPDENNGETVDKAKEAEQSQARAAEAYEAGTKSETAGEYTKARDSYLQAKNSVGDYKDVDTRLKGLEEVIVALTRLDGMPAADPGRAKLEVDYADALRKRNELDHATAELQKAIELNPTLAIAHVTLATVQFESGDLKGSMERANKAAEADASSAEAYYHLAFLNRTAQVEGADPAKATDYAKKAVELSRGNDYKMHELLAACYHDAGNMDGAIAELKEAVRASGGLARLIKKLESWGGKMDPPPADPTPPPADKPPADAPPAADKPPADKPPADAPPADKPPADKPPADKPPADAPPADKPPADAPKDNMGGGQ